jgi:hypothetical protein
MPPVIASRQSPDAIGMRIGQPVPSRRRGAMKKTATSESHPTSKRPVSERKASANRANAQRSTGPRTAASKTRSSLNALRHGILARAAFNVTIEGEERRPEFDALVAGLAQEFQPRTMTEHLTVQQLAGCYWRLAKVWTYETESAWRANVGLVMPLEEFNEWDEMEMQMVVRRNQVMKDQIDFFPDAGLGNPTIPSGATARTILRYQGAINTMMTRCLAILERRRKERMQAGDTFEERDYINEPTAEADASSDASKPATPAEKPAEPSVDSALHKRTQKDAADAPVSSSAEVKSHAEAPAATPVADPNRRETP